MAPFLHIKTAKKFFLAFICIILVAAFLSPSIPVKATAEEAVNEAVSVMISENKQYIELTYSLTDAYCAEHGGSALAVFELLPHMTANDIPSLTPAVADLTPQKEFTVNVPLTVGSATKLYSSFVLAEKRADGSYVQICAPKYIENPEILAENSAPHAKPLSKKGLNVQFFADAQSLGAAHTVITVPINEYFSTDQSSAMNIVRQGKTFYFDSAKILLLDHRIKVLSGAGMNIYLNLVLTAPSNTDEEFLFLYRNTESEDARYFAPNLKDAEGAEAFGAIVRFLAERYMREDGRYGYADNFILGYEVNSGRNTNYAGDLSLPAYAEEYAKALRLTATAVRSLQSDASVYVSVANNFTAPSKGDTFSATLDYAGRDFLTALNTTVKAGGDFPWNVAINPYAVDLSSAAFWSESGSDFDVDAAYITMNNIEVLDRFISGVDFMYGTSRRSIVISEYAASSNGGEALQAAAYAYAYYKAEAIGGIEALIYGAHNDAVDSLYHFGLIATNPDGTPGAKRSIYRVFQYIDTATSGRETEFALQVIGTSRWGDVVSGYNGTTQEKRYTVEDIPLFARKGKIPSKYRLQSLFDFSSSLESFYPSENARLIELGTDPEEKTALHAVMYASVADEYRGISKIYDTPAVFEETDYISLQIYPSAPQDGENVNVMIRLSGHDSEDKEIIYEGAAQVPAGKYTTLNFKITDFLSRTDNTVEGIKVWIKPLDVTGAGNYEFWLRDISVGVLKHATVWTVLGTILLILLIIAALFGILIGALYLRALHLERRRREHVRRMNERRLGHGVGTKTPANGKRPKRPAKKMNTLRSYLPVKLPKAQSADAKSESQSVPAEQKPRGGAQNGAPNDGQHAAATQPRMQQRPQQNRPQNGKRQPQQSRPQGARTSQMQRRPRQNRPQNGRSSGGQQRPQQGLLKNSGTTPGQPRPGQNRPQNGRSTQQRPQQKSEDRQNKPQS